jgi:hypothetical protein
MATNSRARFIYRIETKDRQGPYNHKTYEAPTEWARHPTPCRDPELGYWYLKDPDSWVFGFRSLAQLRHWFYRAEWRLALHRNGFRISKYRIPAGKARVSDAQAIFHKRSGLLVGTMPLA